MRTIVVSGQPFLTKTSFVRNRQRVRLYANERFLRIEVRSEAELEAMSINHPYKILFLKRSHTLRLQGKNYPVFTEDGALRPQQATLLDRADFQKFMKTLSLGKAESIHFTGGLVIYLAHPSLEHALEVIEHAHAFLGPLVSHLQSESPVQKVDFSVLPPQFKPLIGLMRAWGITDDSGREEKREESSDRVLRLVVEEVKPYFPAINSYLDSFGDKEMPEAATVLGALAEFADETQLLLDSKSKKK